MSRPPIYGQRYDGSDRRIRIQIHCEKWIEDTIKKRNLNPKALLESALRQQLETILDRLSEEEVRNYIALCNREIQYHEIEAEQGRIKTDLALKRLQAIQAIKQNITGGVTV